MRDKEFDLNIKAKIGQIENIPEIGDIPSVLKGFGRFSRKPYISIVGLKGKRDSAIDNPYKIRGKIDGRVAGALRDSQQYSRDLNCANYFNENTSGIMTLGMKMKQKSKSIMLTNRNLNSRIRHRWNHDYFKPPRKTLMTTKYKKK